jgi:Second Messenger Oligonucleotide or Dinucleotide Synthetase domain
VKLHDHFAGLLRGAVNINPDRLRQLDDHVAALSERLREDPKLSSTVRGFLPQGSWAHRTIIKPLPGHEFDADLLVQMKQQRAWSDDPQRYLLAVYDVLSKSARYRNRVTLKTRCVRVSYAGECHVDLVPYVHENMYGWFDRHLIVNRRQNRFEEVNPAGFSQWMVGRDRVAHGNLRTTLRLLKYMRDYKATFDVPSAILTVLVGGRVNRFLSFWDDRYRDLPTAFTALVKSTDCWLQDHPELPRLPDPSCPNVSFEHRLNEQRYAQFRERFHGYTDKIGDAYDATRRTGSIQLWQEIFGEGFIPVSP